MGLYSDTVVLDHFMCRQFYDWVDCSSALTADLLFAMISSDTLVCHQLGCEISWLEDNNPEYRELVRLGKIRSIDSRKNEENSITGIRKLDKHFGHMDHAQRLNYLLRLMYAIEHDHQYSISFQTASLLRLSPNYAQSVASGDVARTFDASRVAGWIIDLKCPSIRLRSEALQKKLLKRFSDWEVIMNNAVERGLESSGKVESWKKTSELLINGAIDISPSEVIDLLKNKSALSALREFIRLCSGTCTSIHEINSLIESERKRLLGELSLGGLVVGIVGFYVGKKVPGFSALANYGYKYVKERNNWLICLDRFNEKTKPKPRDRTDL